MSWGFALALFIAVILSLLPFSAGANYGNYNSIIIGDHAAGMGGAYTAMHEDASAIAWYNPAGLALLKGQAFAASVGIYKKFDTVYDQNADLIQGSLRANQGFFRPVPASTGNVIRFKDFLEEWTMGMSIVVPSFESFKGEIYNQNNNLSTFSLSDESLWVGGAMAKKISETEAFGFTLYYTARSVSKSVVDRYYVNATDSTIYNEEKAYTQNALVLLLGYHKKLSEYLKWGLSFRFPGAHLAGKGSYQDTLIVNGAMTSHSPDQMPSFARIPGRLSLGLAYDEPDFFTIAMDWNFYSDMNYMDIESSEFGERIRHKPIFNISIGGEYHYRPWLKFRAGFFTNFSAHPDPDKNEVHGQGDRTDQLGFSANLALTRGNIQYTFGGYYTGGNGRSVQRINQQYAVVPKSSQVFTMLVGTSYSFD